MNQGATVWYPTWQLGHGSASSMSPMCALNSLHSFEFTSEVQLVVEVDSSLYITMVVVTLVRVCTTDVVVPSKVNSCCEMDKPSPNT
jgi:hypothetical protein